MRGAALLARGLHRDAGEGRTVRKLFIAPEAGNFLNQILFDFDVEAEGRRHHREDAIFERVLEPEALEALLHRFERNVDAHHLAAAVDAHLDGRALGEVRNHILDRAHLGFGRAADVENELRDVFEVLGCARIVDAALIAVGGIGREVELPAAALNRLREPEGGFDEEIRRFVVDGRPVAAHDARQALGLVARADDAVPGGELNRFAVQKLDGFALARPAHGKAVGIQLLDVVEVRRAAELEHHVVRDVDQSRHRTLTGALKARLHPFRGLRLRVEVPDHAAREAAAEVGRLNLDREPALARGGNRSHRGENEGRARNGVHVAGNAHDGERIAAVGRELQLNLRVVKTRIFADVGADRRVVRKDPDAVVVLVDAEFAR